MSFATPEMLDECHKWTFGQNHKILHSEWSISKLKMAKIVAVYKADDDTMM